MKKSKKNKKRSKDKIKKPKKSLVPSKKNTNEFSPLSAESELKILLSTEREYTPKITYKSNSQKTYTEVRKKSYGSEGEILVETYLIQLDITYKKEYSVSINDIEYRFDYAIFSKKDILNPVGFIEYDGVQHLKAVDVFGGENQFKKTQKNDSLKNDYCKERNIKLLRISFEQRSKALEKIRRSFGEYKGIGAEKRIYKI